MLLSPGIYVHMIMETRSSNVDMSYAASLLLSSYTPTSRNCLYYSIPNIMILNRAINYHGSMFSWWDEHFPAKPSRDLPEQPSGWLLGPWTLQSRGSLMSRYREPNQEHFARLPWAVPLGPSRGLPTTYQLAYVPRYWASWVITNGVACGVRLVGARHIDWLIG